MYSIVYQYVSTQTLHLMYRDYQQETLFIVTSKAQEICDAIFNTCHHGASILETEGSHDHQHLKLVYSVVSGADAKKAIHVAQEIDSCAFINSMHTTELRGNFYLKPKD